ncbi:MAG: CDP-alcohol phosphatidyltransferase family protein [Anaerolineaceae bacterium]|nr:CDP-alcohol phosphatidyltransferase family protein [Anaerolineaceae bacterium]
MREEQISVEQFMRKTFKNPLDRISLWLYQKGICANQVTMTGLAGTSVAAILISQAYLWQAGLLLIFIAPLDAVDGSLARLSGQSSRFGAFLDSFTDRYEELLILAGLAYYFAQSKSTLGILLSFFAAIGSVMVSYARARAEALGFECKIGLLTRIERTVIMIIGLLLGLPIFAVGIISVLANFTAWQRFFHVREEANKQDSQRG